MDSPKDSPKDTPHLLIVDAQSLAARAAHVADGDVSNGVRLWCQMARGAALDVGATHLIAAWDHDGPTFRHALFPTYKHRRTGSMRARVQPIRDGVEATGVVSLSVAGFEGDDIVATLMARSRDEARVTLLSNDSDLLQFVADGVDVVTYVGVGKGSNGTRVRSWTAQDVLTRFGVSPTQLPDFKALCGEDGDDIPGVNRIGKGTAVKLLRRWQTLEKALEASEFVSHKDDTAKLAGQHEHARLMLQLTTIRQDAPVPALSLALCQLASITWPQGSTARASAMSNSMSNSMSYATERTSGTANDRVTRVDAGPGLEDVPFPE